MEIGRVAHIERKTVSFRVPSGYFYGKGNQITWKPSKVLMSFVVLWAKTAVGITYREGFGRFACGMPQISASQPKGMPVPIFRP